MKPKLDPRRREHLCSSDMPQIVTDSEGRRISRYGGPEQVQMAKLYGIDQQSSPYADAGHICEPGLIDIAVEHWGLQSGWLQSFRISKENGLFAATLDYDPSGLWRGKRVHCELKCVFDPQRREEYGESGEDIIPDDNRVQIAMQHFTARTDVCLFLVWLIGGGKPEMRFYEIERDVDLIDVLVPQGMEWWKRHIVQRLPVDDLPPLEWLKKIRRGGPVIELDAQTWASYEAWRECRARRSEFREAVADCDHRLDDYERLILAAMGEARQGRFPNGLTIEWREQMGPPGRRLRDDFRPSGFDGLKSTPEGREMFETYFEQRPWGRLVECKT